MTLLEKIKLALALTTKYVPVVTAVVQQVEATGASGADKKQLAVQTVLAVAHEGQKIDNAHIATVSSFVEFAVGIANASGLFGPSKPVSVDVPVIPAS